MTNEHGFYVGDHVIVTKMNAVPNWTRRIPAGAKGIVTKVDMSDEIATSAYSFLRAQFTYVPPAASSDPAFIAETVEKLILTRRSLLVRIDCIALDEAYYEELEAAEEESAGKNLQFPWGVDADPMKEE